MKRKEVSEEVMSIEVCSRSAKQQSSCSKIDRSIFERYLLEQKTRWSVRRACTHFTPSPSLPQEKKTYCFVINRPMIDA